MKPFPRLLRYVRPYWSPLILSVILMAIAGAGHAMMPLLIGPVFDRQASKRTRVHRRLCRKRQGQNNGQQND